jgi:beta-aspartyl-peptidase (threonine type)
MMITGMLCTSNTLWAGDSDVAQKIKTIMAKQVDAWNRGDIEGFMGGYWKSEKFTFQSGNKRLMGWDQLIAMYKKNYAGEKMGKLEFTDIEVKALCTDTYLVLGRWRVTAKDETKEGLFTLLFRRFGKDWKIIHDHSS